eukprot:10908271-Karenia_brevis.AAC.1
MLFHISEACAYHLRVDGGVARYRYNEALSRLWSATDFTLTMLYVNSSYYPFLPTGVRRLPFGIGWLPPVLNTLLQQMTLPVTLEFDIDYSFPLTEMPSMEIGGLTNNNAMSQWIDGDCSFPLSEMPCMETG